MTLKVIKTTDHRFEGLSFPFNINDLPSSVPVAPGVVFADFKVLRLGDNKYKIYNNNYVVEVKEVDYEY